MNARTGIAVAVAVVAVVAIGAVVLLRQHAGPEPVKVGAVKMGPAASSAPAPAVAGSTGPAPDCLLPGPPPVAPDGGTASAADMKLGHDVIQAFVLQLEAFQACRNALIDHAPPTVSLQQKQAWLDQGNGAIDEADELAAKFSIQLRAFHARSGKVGALAPAPAAPAP